MRITKLLLPFFVFLLVALSCVSYEGLSEVYTFPLDNPPNTDKIALGRKLFFDKRLSKDGTLACADCHRPEFAFTDRKPRSIGINGQLADRNAPSLLNSAYLETVMFDAHLKTLELQVIVPIQEPTEMGHNMKILIPKLRAIPEYQNAARAIFNRDFDAWVLTRSIAAFERSLLSWNSRYDQYMAGKKKAMNRDEIKGLEIFNKSYCINCHPAPYFTNFKAENNGFYKEGSLDKGRFRVSLDSNDIGVFKTPSLRNITLTFPYMHDGSLSSLEDVLNHYMVGGRHPKGQNGKIVPFELSQQEMRQLLAFFGTLTDTNYMKSFRPNDK